MPESKKVVLLDPDGNAVAELLIADEEEGWYTGKVVSQNYSSDVKKALAWYDEVVRDQMLSYLDEATAAVEQLGLRAHFPDDSTQKIYSLHVTPSKEVSFRTSPVPPPSWLPREVVQ